ncbi:MAG TPA: hypothetical protein VFU71_03880 [Burkholderiaceae bacterium]|nr:hypothetical protein [Burkholderiaceae bacterium]
MTLFRRAVGFSEAEEALHEFAMAAAVESHNVAMLKAVAARPDDLFALCYTLDVYGIDVTEAAALAVDSGKRRPFEPPLRNRGNGRTL